MQVKNISARGWMIDGTFLKPGETAEIDNSWHTAIKDNAELVVIGEVEEKKKPGRPAKTEE